MTRVFFQLVCVISIGSIAATISPNALALDTFSLKSSLGLAVQSDGNYSTAAGLNMSSGKWLFDTNVSGYSESGTRVVHVLSGVLYRVPLTQAASLTTEFGLGMIIAETTALGRSEKMFNYSLPVGVTWQIFALSGFAMDLNWRSWVFPSDQFPLMALLSHDRITTLGVSVGWSK